MPQAESWNNVYFRVKCMEHFIGDVHEWNVSRVKRGRVKNQKISVAHTEKWIVVPKLYRVRSAVSSVTEIALWGAVRYETLQTAVGANVDCANKADVFGYWRSKAFRRSFFHLLETSKNNLLAVGSCPDESLLIILSSSLLTKVSSLSAWEDESFQTRTLNTEWWVMMCCRLVYTEKK